MPTVLGRSKLLPTLRDITSTVSRRKLIRNDCMMVCYIKNVICNFNCLMPNVPTARLFNIILK